MTPGRDFGPSSFATEVSDRLRDLGEEAHARFLSHIPLEDLDLYPRPVILTYLRLLHRAYDTPLGVDKATQHRRLRNYERKLEKHRCKLDRIHEISSLPISSGA